MSERALEREQSKRKKKRLQQEIVNLTLSGRMSSREEEIYDVENLSSLNYDTASMQRYGSTIKIPTMAVPQHLEAPYTASRNP